CGAGSASSQLDNRRQIGRRQGATETFSKSPPVGIVPIALAVPKDDCVDGAKSRGLIRQYIDIGNNCLLAGMGNIQPAETRIFNLHKETIQISSIVFQIIEIQ